MMQWRRFIYIVRSSIWFVPGVMASVAVLLGLAFAEYDFGFDGGPGFAQVTAETGMPVASARSILSTIVGSMITVTTLVFSMTLVAMTLVAQQLGPRIVIRFMDNRPTQIFLGLFLATFLFALIVLVRVGYADANRQVPNIAIVLSTALVILSMGAIIAFIHNVASRIQADQIVAELGQELRVATSRLVDHGGGEAPFVSNEEMKELDELFQTGDIVAIAAPESGYLNVLDAQAALSFLDERDLVVRVVSSPGDFVLQGTPVLEVAAQSMDDDQAGKIEDHVPAMISLLSTRTAELTLDFEVNALTEVALRALSPGINDPYTARACIHRLGTGLRALLDHPGRPPVTRGKEQAVRIVHHLQPFGYYCSLALRPLMNAGRDHAEVLAEIAYMLGALGAITERKDRGSDIVENLDALEETVESCKLIAADRAWVKEQIAEARDRVGRQMATLGQDNDD
jgi:uncharacterized membrane protein